MPVTAGQVNAALGVYANAPDNDAAYKAAVNCLRDYINGELTLVGDYEHEEVSLPHIDTGTAVGFMVAERLHEQGVVTGPGTEIRFGEAEAPGDTKVRYVVDILRDGE